MPDDARARLAKAQGVLVESLTAGAPVPPGFDAAQVRRTALSLLRKRARSAARVWPALADALGERYTSLFMAYADQYPLPPDASSLTDGRQFGLWLERWRHYPDAALAERLAFNLHYAVRGGRTHPRRGLVLRVARISGRRWALAFRLPGIGARSLTLPRLL